MFRDIKCFARVYHIDSAYINNAAIIQWCVSLCVCMNEKATSETGTDNFKSMWKVIRMYQDRITRYLHFYSFSLLTSRGQYRPSVKSLHYEIEQQ